MQKEIKQNTPIIAHSEIFFQVIHYLNQLYTRLALTGWNCDIMLLGFHSQLQNCSTLTCKRKWSGKRSYNFVLLCLESLPGKTQEKEWANAGSLQDSVSCWGHGGNGRNLLLNVLLQYHQTAHHFLASSNSVTLFLFSSSPAVHFQSSEHKFHFCTVHSKLRLLSAVQSSSHLTWS